METTSLNIDELKGFMKHMISNNRYLQNEAAVPVTIGIEGLSGIGKTSALLQIAKENNLKMIRLNLAEIEELGD